MNVGSSFKGFCKNLSMSEDTVTTIRNRYKVITKTINKKYWNSISETSNSLYVGSYGRDTDIWASDIDILIKLPWEIHDKYNSYLWNGQSALLQDVKETLGETYYQSKLKGDGQIVGIDFYDGISFEIVPCFKHIDDTFTYPDTHEGGRWFKTNPIKEIEAIRKLNNETNKNLKRLCRMLRAWKNHNNVRMSGMLIDTLAYNFIISYSYKKESYFFYDWLSRDFFEYLSNIDESRNYWFAPGSNDFFAETVNFSKKAQKSYYLSLEAIKLEMECQYDLSKKKWREIYGTKFPN